MKSEAKRIVEQIVESGAVKQLNMVVFLDGIEVFSYGDITCEKFDSAEMALAYVKGMRDMVAIMEGERV